MWSNKNLSTSFYEKLFDSVQCLIRYTLWLLMFGKDWNVIVDMLSNVYN